VGAPGVRLSDGFSLTEAIQRWVAEDAPGDDYGARRAAAARVEYRVYLEGWRDAVREMWVIAQRAL
jgi:hypothetical protein